MAGRRRGEGDRKEGGREGGGTGKRERELRRREKERVEKEVGKEERAGKVREKGVGRGERVEIEGVRELHAFCSL